MEFKRVILAALTVAPVLSGIASANPQIDRVSRALRQAERVVVGQVSAVEPIWKSNEHGDQLIVSRAWVRADETLKGTPATDVAIEIEGGTLGGLTLKVSDMPTMRPGDRAVFVLRRGPAGEWLPHDRGAGVMRVDANGNVAGAGMPLEQLRQLARQVR
jgi:hypothetical protein